MAILAVGDQRWLRAAYEHNYSVFSPFVAEEGRPLGHLFLNKLFQVRVELPKLGASQYEEYLSGLLGGGSESVTNGDATPAPVPDQSTVGASSYDRAIAADQTQSSAQRSETLGVALEMRRRDAGRQERELHLLAKYAELLDPNPRSAKRFVMTYNMAFAARVLEDGPPLDPDTMALWTVLSIRWPELTDWIRSQGAYLDLKFRACGAPAHPSKLLDAPEVERVMRSPKGGPLDEARVLRCCGVFRTPTASSP